MYIVYICVIQNYVLEKKKKKEKIKVRVLPKEVKFTATEDMTAKTEQSG